jgi:hypothetical protein
MPSRERLARTRQQEEDANDPRIVVTLRAYMKRFVMPMSLFLTIPFFAVRLDLTTVTSCYQAFELGLISWMEAYLAAQALDAHSINLGNPNIHPAIFTILVQWLLNMPIWSSQDLSGHLPSAANPTSSPRTSPSARCSTRAPLTTTAWCLEGS